jgi:hypothetical protein
MLAIGMLALRGIAAAAGWLACVLGARMEMPLVGPALVGVMLVAHAATLADPLRQFRSVLIIGVLGTLAESAWIAAGAYAPVDAMRGSLLCPLWITALWLNTAVFLQGAPATATAKSLAVAALSGAILTPAGYALAAWLGAIFVALQPGPALIAAAVYGALIGPVAVWLTHGRLSRLAPSPPHASHESNHG